MEDEVPDIFSDVDTTENDKEQRVIKRRLGLDGDAPRTLE